ncbi:MAG: hypothetical protein HW413_2226 [Thermoleophilia bacterium]|nr:hypothetical protein [Thermoleophilia bacterium]
MPMAQAYEQLETLLTLDDVALTLRISRRGVQVGDIVVSIATRKG